MERFSQRIRKLKEDRLHRVIQDRGSGLTPRIVIKGKTMINFSSNDYLGLANNPDITTAAKSAIDSFGFGSGASRLLSGGTSLHRDLERATARFKETGAGLLFNSGYAANTGVIPAIAGEHDVILSDEMNHASIIDGCRLSRARTVIYKHRDAGRLRELLQQEAGNGTIVVTDTVFSMDGDLAPLADIADLCRKYHALLYIDDAHGTGVMGKGKGALAHFGITPEPWIIQMVTFSKALGSFGAFVCGTEDVIEWILNTARSFIFSTALPPSVAAASTKALEIIETKPELIEKLWENRDKLVHSVRELGYDIGETETPIIPMRTQSIKEALTLSAHLSENGIFAPAIRPPTVTVPRVRITVSAVHSEEDISCLIQALTSFPRDKAVQ